MSRKPDLSPRRRGGSYRVGTWLFLRLLGLVYLIAFVSLWVQIAGLVGSDGILPVADYLDWARRHAGAERYWQLPTLLWLGDGDLALQLLCGGGAALSLALMAGIAPLPVLLLLWAGYLSLAVGGQTFLGFQWDTLLLEAGFCALFVAPAAWRPTPPRRAPVPRRAGLWLVWLLLFKLMFLSGAVKPLSLDETWWRLTALDYHYWTQPLPTWISWYADRLPAWFDKLSVLLTYAIEIALPFLLFAGPRGRRAVAAGTGFLMLMIAWTGNYGFFNLLTMVLAIPLLDDALWARWLPLSAVSGVEEEAARGRRRGLGALLPLAATLPPVLLMALSGLTMARELARTVPPGDGPLAAAVRVADSWLLSWSEPTVLRWARPFRTVNGYGLFRAMTTERPEIVIEGSRDGVSWTPYEFQWKPGDPARRPRFVAPHMPRLDWQMWFAALDPRRAEPWLAGLLRGLLRGSPDILGLLARDPFAGQPPRYVRLVYFGYRFATPSERRQRGVWWSREPLGSLTAPLTREDLAGGPR